MIGELLPIVATFLVVNVILLVQAGARGQLGRLGASARTQQPALQLAAATTAERAAEPVPAGTPEPPLAQVPGPRITDESAGVRRYQRPVAIVRLELEGLDGLTGLPDEEAHDRLLRALADTLRRPARDAAATSGEVDLGDSQGLAAERMHGGQPCDVPLAGTVAVQRPVATAATPTPVTYVSCAPTPKRAWDRCREPNCDHKKDHRRDRRR